MRGALLSGYTFNPSLRQVDLSGVTGFDPRRLLAIIHLPTNELLYAQGDEDLGASDITGSVVTLLYDTGTMQPTDLLAVLYDDGTLPLPIGAASEAKLEAVRALLAGSTVTADASGTLAAGSVATPVAANLTRQFVEITNTGGEALSYRWGAAASAAVGHILSPGQSVRYESKVPTAALNLFSANGTTFFVTTG